jgi:nicotinamide phosphoribosyltransferase
VKNVLMTIENTDPECYWLTSFLETALLRAVWYPTTVATNSYESKKIILKALERTGDPSLVDFKLHDFGARGVSSFESAGIGAAAHLINFMGTDTITGLLYAREYYNADMAGFSIPAMEHSTVTSWGRENEVEAYRNMLNRYAKPGAIIAAVSDSYDIYEACKLWGTELKQQIIDSGATLVVRPDSGDPATVVLGCLTILEEYFGSTVNNKGYRVLNNVRVIQGDGINADSINLILDTIADEGYSADNVAFGQGGALLQQVNRDTMKFAMKCSAAKINGEWVPVFKDPVTDPGKQSKKGRVTLYKDSKGFRSGVEDWETPVLVTVFENGKLLKEYTFDQVRANARI